MFKLNWIRCLISSAFLRSCLQYEAVDETKTRLLSKILTQTEYNCSCKDGKGRIYNLAPLQSIDGPRFTALDSKYPGYTYKYNPCRSFSLGQGKVHCSGGDVAVCRVTSANDDRIGRQSTFHCDSADAEDKPPQLIYSGDIHGWKVKIHLECNKSLQGDGDGEFYFINYKESSWQFRLAHKCACPDGCLEDPPADPTGTLNDWKKIWIPVIAGTGSFVFVVIVTCLVCKFKTQNNEECERQRLFDQERNIENINNFNDLDGVRTNENVSQPMSVSSSSLSANMESTKIKNNDIFKDGSVPV